MNLIKEAGRMTIDAHKEEKMDLSYNVCLCGELIKILFPQGDLKDCLEDDDDCRQHFKCLGKNIVNKLNGTQADKFEITGPLRNFETIMSKRRYGAELTEAEKEEYLYLLK